MEHFQQAQEALNQQFPTEEASVTQESDQGGTQDHNGQTAEEAEAQAIMELDKATKFKFKGQEYTPEQLEKAMMRHSDYTKKTQALAEERKYIQNLPYDLEQVRSNPSLVGEFLKLYPKQYHGFVKEFMNSQQVDSSMDSAKSQLDPQFLDRFNRLENYVKEKEVQAIEAQLDNKFSKLSQKYPEAIEDVVLARAQVLLDQLQQENPAAEITDQMWEKLWKSSHESMLNRFNSKQQQTLNKQRNANLAGKAQGPGGGTPAQAPRRMKFDEATEYAIQSLTGNN